MSFGKPEPMSLEKIQKTIDEFAFAAEECHKAGFDGVELHGAHGYLLAQFLAQTTNKRTDKYGGSLENRSRIIFEIVDEIKKRVKDESFSISIKINSVEFQSGGFDTKECAELCKKLEAAGLDFVELSGGTYEELAFSKRDSTQKREAFFLEFADVIRPSLNKTLVYVTGGFRTGKAMVDAVQHGSCHGIGLARPVCSELTLCRDLASNKVSAAIKPDLDENDFGTSNILAGTFMSIIGRGGRPFDSSDSEKMKHFNEKVQEYMQKMGSDMKAGVVSAGYPIIDLS